MGQAVMNGGPASAKQSSARLQGRCVKWIADRGYGFVKHDNGPDVFVHFSELPEGVTELEVGQRIEFETRAEQRGRVLGVRVTLARTISA
jgi:CspA family cold shock protein